MTRAQLDTFLRGVSKRAEAESARFSLSTTEDGRQIVVIDTAQDIFEGVTDPKELRRIARQYILDNFRNDVYQTKDGKGVIFTRKGAKKITNTEYLSKIRISTELNNLIKVADYVKTEPNTKTVNPEFSYFDYYKAEFILDGKPFECLINVGVNTKTKTGVFYEVTQIKEAPHNSFDGINSVAPASNGANTIIHENSEKSTVSEKNAEKIKERSVTPISSQQNVRLKGGDDVLLNNSISQNSENVNTNSEKSPQNLSLEELDTYARENIEGYNKLGAANQSMIRSVLRGARAAGVEESFALSCARVSARSGLNIVFNKKLCFVKKDGSFADGAIDLKNNRIIIKVKRVEPTSVLDGGF